MINEIGNKYGKLTVIQKAKKPEGRPAGAYWLCQCECGKQKIIRGADLRTGAVNSCGCLYGKHSIVNEIGNRYGKLLVIEQTDNRAFGNVKWLCRCDCGELCEVSGSSLRTGQTKSCGCLKKENSRKANLKDITQQRFGKLVALEIDEQTTHEKGRVFWKCQCDCGKITSIYSSNLINGITKSCGCIRSSYGEEQIEKILIENNINYCKEYTFSDLHTNNVPLRFDFAIFNKQHQLIQLIEYDGKQHYIPVEKFGGEKAFNHMKLNDERKNKYCKEHNIKLVRIPYTNLDIKLKDLEVD